MPGAPGRRLLAVVRFTISLVPCRARTVGVPEEQVRAAGHDTLHLQLRDRIRQLLSQVEQVLVVGLVREHLRAARAALKHSVARGRAGMHASVVVVACSIRSRWAVQDWSDCSRFWAVAASSTVLRGTCPG